MVPCSEHRPPLGMNSDSFLMATSSLGGNLASFPRNPLPFPTSSGSLTTNLAPFSAGACDPGKASFLRDLSKSYSRVSSRPRVSVQSKVKGLAGPGSMSNPRVGGLQRIDPAPRSGGPMDPGSGPTLGQVPNLRSGFIETNLALSSGMFPGLGLGSNPRASLDLASIIGAADLLGANSAISLKAFGKPILHDNSPWHHRPKLMTQLSRNWPSRAKSISHTKGHGPETIIQFRGLNLAAFSQSSGTLASNTVIFQRSADLQGSNPTVFPRIPGTRGLNLANFPRTSGLQGPSSAAFPRSTGPLGSGHDFPRSTSEPLSSSPAGPVGMNPALSARLTGTLGLNPASFPRMNGPVEKTLVPFPSVGSLPSIDAFSRSGGSMAAMYPNGMLPP
ncbi:unnamed protein product [Nyctereutes procyonoides]|uniref:(raccoon dog) hypothetical protein n=1 Tax=Nyctereutes procyonoides TaxID=34880 RepID=A0A811ZDV5_NYCPR|nr:unnamed protein product [Nyctereutes procyonoides]